MSGYRVRLIVAKVTTTVGPWAVMDSPGPDGFAGRRYTYRPERAAVVPSFHVFEVMAFPGSTAWSLLDDESGERTMSPSYVEMEPAP